MSDDGKTDDPTINIEASEYDPAPREFSPRTRHLYELAAKVMDGRNEVPLISALTIGALKAVSDSAVTWIRYDFTAVNLLHMNSGVAEVTEKSAGKSNKGDSDGDIWAKARMAVKMPELIAEKKIARRKLVKLCMVLPYYADP